jgi:DNA-directed RNA polymerase specialized sigma54-like protein
VSEKYPRVTVQSTRPDSTGRNRFGQTGEGVVLDDDTSIVYVTGKDWYGEWPVQDTDVAAIRQAREAARKSREEATIGDEATAELNSYEYLLRQLQQQGLSPTANSSGNKTVALVDSHGNYLRLPSIDEFRLNWDELTRKGLVKTDA